MYKILLNCFFLSIALSFSSCGPNYISAESHDIPASGWSYADTINFQVEIVDANKIYNMYLEINHHGDFSYQNIYTNIYTKFPDQKRLKKQVSIDLANKAGQWYGGKSGENYNYLIPIQENLFFDQTGRYTITIEQFMRINPLKGVNSIGLKIEDTGAVKNQ